MSEENKKLEPRILRLPIAEEDAGKTIKEYLMKRIGFSSRQLSRFKYRKDGILLNGEKRYVNAPLQAGDLLEIRLTRGGEPVEEHPHDALNKSQGMSACESACRPWAIGTGKPEEGEKGYGEGARAGENPAKDGGFPNGAGYLPAKDGHFPVKDGYLPAKDGRLQKIWAPPAAWLNEKYPFRILYEDQDILAADKPSGVVCHPSPGHYDDTLSNQLAEHLGRTGQELDVRVTGRLDRDTSGIVIFALNTETAAQLIKQRQASMMQKLYIARVRGDFVEVVSCGGPARGVVDRPLRRESRESFRMVIAEDGGPAWGVVDRPLRRESRESFRTVIAEDGKPARTYYRILARFEDGTSLVACRIEHGRTHQIRVHMASIGHPIVGDRLYGPEAGPEEEAETRKAYKPDPVLKEGAGNGGKGREDRPPLMLHAFRAVLRQPFSGEEIRIEAPLPEWAGNAGGLPGELLIP